MGSVDTRIRALEARSERFTQDIVVIDDGVGPFRLMIQGAELSQEFMGQVGAVRLGATLDPGTVTPKAADITADRLSAGRSK